MARPRRRSRAEAGAIRGVQAVMLREGAKVRGARLRRRWTQAQLGRRAKLAQTTVSKLERGAGAGLSVAAWQRVADALGIPLDLKLGRDQHEAPADAGHLALQELVLRLGRRAGYGRTFELPNRPTAPSAWADVGLIDHRRRRLLLVECVNVLGDIGASVRSSDRKLADAEPLGIAFGGEAPYAVHCCWVLRDTRRNRALVTRYPELFAARFPASSRAWIVALMTGASPPIGRGLVWADSASTRVLEWRRRTASGVD